MIKSALLNPYADFLWLMKVKIGAFSEGAVNEVVKMLKSLGIGVDVRRFINVNMIPLYFVEGRYSDLRNKYEETELIEDIRMWKSMIDLVKDCRSLEDLMKRVIESVENEIESYAKLGILMDMLEMNGISVDDEISGEVPDDPYLSFPYDVDDEKAKKLDLKRKLVITTELVCEVFADLGDAILNEEDLVEACKENDLFLGLLLLTGSVEALIEKIGRKISVEKLNRLRRLKLGEGVEVRFGEGVVGSILDVLQDLDVVKVKRGWVSLK